MEYDDIIQTCDPGEEVKERFFQVYIAPLLKDVKSTRHLPYFFHQGYTAWRLDIKPEDSKQVKFIEWMCQELSKTHESDLVELLSLLLAQGYEANVRTEQAERNAYNSSIREDKLSIFSDKVRLYKIFFENEFRLHSTIPYFFVDKVYCKKHEVTNTSDFINVAAGEKYQALKNIQVSLAQGDLSKLVFGFDNQIRNAGEGHDRWEVTDDNMLTLPIVAPKTGKEKKRIELTEKELDDLIKQCRKTIWIMRMGYTIFLENNKEFEKKLKGKPLIKLREIEDNARAFADNRWFDIKKFQVNEDKSQLTIALRYRSRVIGTKTQVFFGNAEAYDLIENETFVPYEYQMLDILKCILSYFGEGNHPKVVVEMFGEKEDSFGKVEYEPTELSKLFIEEGDIQFPIPSKGSVPDYRCRLVTFIKVPYGTRGIFEKLIKEMRNQDYDNKRNNSDKK